jgi:hypothetical protein
MKIIITESKLNKVVLKWLDKEFGNLTEVVRGDKTIYVDQDGLPLFYYYQDSKNGYVFINYERIWQLLESIFDMEYEQIRDILKIWLEETYNLRGVTPHIALRNVLEELEETYNLKGVTPLPIAR